MALEWMPRDNEAKDHALHREPHWGTDAPCAVYEKKPVLDPKGNAVEGLYTAWIRLNNPKQYNSYTTDMVKGVPVLRMPLLIEALLPLSLPEPAPMHSVPVAIPKNILNIILEDVTNTASIWNCSTTWLMPSLLAKNQLSVV